LELRTKSTALFSRARKIWNLPTKATQINNILFCCAVKFFGICQQKQLTLSACCSSAQRKFWNCEQKHWFDQPRSENWNCEQKHCISLAAHRKFWSCYQKHCILSAAKRKFWNSPTKTTQTDCINLGIYRQKQLKLN
jgi:hypothetical protein